MDALGDAEGAQARQQVDRQRAHADAGKTPHVRTLAAAAAGIYDQLIVLAPNRRPARLEAAVAAIKADAGGGA